MPQHPRLSRPGILALVLLGVLAAAVSGALGTPRSAAAVTFTGCTLGAPQSGCMPTVSGGTETGRITNNGVASSCAAPKASPGLGDSTMRLFDQFNYTNSSTATECVTVTLTEVAPSCVNVNLKGVAYLGSFISGNPLTNYLADAGDSDSVQTFAFLLGTGQTAPIVVQAQATVGTGAGCQYTLQVNGGPVSFTGCAIATPSASCTPTVSGGMQTGRITNNGVASSCAAAKPNPGQADAVTRLFDQFTYTNTSAATECVSVTLTEGPSNCVNVNLKAVAYLGSFNSGNPLTNYLADAGDSDAVQTLSFLLGAGQTVQIVIQAQATVGTGEGCQYSLEIDAGPPQPDLTTAKTCTPATVAANGATTCTITVTNAGAASAVVASGAVLVRDAITFPAGTTVTKVSDVVPAGYACNAGAVSGGQRLIDCSATTQDTITPGSTRQFLLVLTLTNATNMSRTITDIATADPGQVIAEFDDANNASPRRSVTVQVFDPAPSLSFTMADTPDPVRTGQTLTYTFTITNTGSVPVTGITLSANLPARLTPGTVTKTPASVTCSVTQGGQRLSCSIGTLTSGQTATVTLQMTVGASPGQQLAASATVNASAVDGTTNMPVTLTRSASTNTLVKS